MPATPVALEPEQIVKIMLSKIGDIATLPEVTAKIIGAVDDPKSTAHDLHKIIKNDPAVQSGPVADVLRRVGIGMRPVAGIEPAQYRALYPHV